MSNKARTSEQIKDKVLAFMKLALEHNRNGTEQKLTEDRPRLLEGFKGIELEVLLFDEQ